MVVGLPRLEDNPWCFSSGFDEIHQRFHVPPG